MIPSVLMFSGVPIPHQSIDSYHHEFTHLQNCQIPSSKIISSAAFSSAQIFMEKCGQGPDLIVLFHIFFSSQYRGHTEDTSLILGDGESEKCLSERSLEVKKTCSI